MKYKLLGRSGLRVSEICLGTMSFGTEWGWGSTHEESQGIMDAFVEAGGNFVDTANMYTKGTSEKFVGEFISKNREWFVLATKYSISTDKNDPNACGNHRKNMMQAVEASLKRLNTEYIDLYWLHVWDFLTPIEEVMRGLEDLVRQGKVLYVGISDTPAWVVSRANMLAELRGWARFVALQIEYSLIERTPERDLIPMAQSLDLAVTPWGPLAGGVLTGKYNVEKGKEDQIDKRRSPSDARLSDRSLRIASKVVEVAKELDKTPAQVAINWARQQHPQIIPIVGARNAKQIRDSLGCLEFEIPKEHLQQLDEVSKIDLGFPHEFVRSEGVRTLVLGKHADNIINHRQ